MFIRLYFGKSFEHWKLWGLVFEVKGTMWYFGISKETIPEFILSRIK